jgi:hypothetical protein
MSHDQNNQCQDNSSVVDTSNGPLPGLRAFVASRGTTSDCQQPLRVFTFWSLRSSCSSVLLS